MGFFTGAWSLLGFASGVLPLQVASCVLIAAAVFFVIGSTLVGSSTATTRIAPARSAIGPAPSDSRFVVAVIAETVVIVAMVLLMLQLHLPQYVVPLVAVIVGAHFFVFIRPGDRAVHVVAGIAGVVVGLTGIALIAGNTLEPLFVRGIIGCSFALITTYYGCYFLTWRFIGADDDEDVR